MAEISACPRATPDYPWAASDFTRGQRANCSLVMLQQSIGNQFPSNCFAGVNLAMCLLCRWETRYGVQSRVSEEPYGLLADLINQYAYKSGFDSALQHFSNPELNAQVSC